MKKQKNSKLTDEQLKTISAKLNETRDALESSEGERESQTLRGAGAQDDQVELDGSREADEDLSAEMMEVELGEILDIDDALEKLAAGDYGLCEECDAEISPKRLLVKPEARYCVPCQEALEKEEAIRTKPHEVPDFQFPEE